MSSSQTLGGISRCGRVLGPSLDKIVKNAAWRKHSHLVAACKSALDKLETLSDSFSDPNSPLSGITLSDSEFVLQPILLAIASAYPKVVEPALDCAFKLFSLGLIRGEIDSARPQNVAFKMVEAVCKSGGQGDEAVELAVLRVLLAAVRSPCVLIRGDCLVSIVRTCYNVYLGGQNGTNQICAKSVLAQAMVIVFTRVEEDSMDVNLKRISVNELLEFTDKNLNEGSSIYFCQNFVNEIMDTSEGVTSINHSMLSPAHKLQNGNGTSVDAKDAQVEDDDAGAESGNGGGTKIREDGFLLFRNLCKLSMKFSSQEHPDDQILLRGKILSLELLKVIMDNGGSIWRSNERYVIAHGAGVIEPLL